MKIFSRKVCPTSLIARFFVNHGIGRGYASVFALVASIAFAAGLAAQSDNFNDGNDNGWTHLDLSAAGTPATFTFPADGLGGKAYQIKSGAPSDDSVGPARAFSYPANSYTRFSIGADMITWDTTVDQAFGLLVRATSIGLGTTDGYVMNYNAADGNLQLNRVESEAAVETIAEMAVPLSPAGGPYRWVFSAYAENFLGQVFVLPDVLNPVASVVAIDGNFPSGQAGLFVFNRGGTPEEWVNPASIADATFDNYNGTVPAAGSLRATVVQLSPYPKEPVSASFPQVGGAILNRETSVDTNSVQLWVDGVQISSNNLTLTAEVTVPNNAVPFAGATVSYQVTNVFVNDSVHTNRLVYSDGVGLQTNEWTFHFLANVTVVLQSTATLSPPDFQVESGAAVDTATRTITVAQSGAQRFYRLSSASALSISSISVSGNNIVMTYQ